MARMAALSCRQCLLRTLVTTEPRESSLTRSCTGTPASRALALRYLVPKSGASPAATSHLSWRISAACERPCVWPQIHPHLSCQVHRARLAPPSKPQRMANPHCSMEAAHMGTAAHTARTWQHAEVDDGRGAVGDDVVAGRRGRQVRDCDRAARHGGQLAGGCGQDARHQVPHAPALCAGSQSRSAQMLRQVSQGVLCFSLRTPGWSPVLQGVQPESGRPGVPGPCARRDAPLV